MFFKLLLETRMAHDKSCALEKIVMTEECRNIQSPIFISSICGKITVLARIFIYPLPQCLGHQNWQLGELT